MKGSETCRTCDGRGWVSDGQPEDGRMTGSETCRTCDGRGWVRTVIEYVWNLSPNSYRIHVRENGRTLESCNVDQITRMKVLTELPTEGKWYRCFRCFPIRLLSAGETTGGVAQ